MKPFVAIDGEAVKPDDAYVLLCRSDGYTLTDLDRGGLSTVDCLEFLLDGPKDAIHVCFGLGYDVNQWLRDLPRDALKRLWEKKVCWWRDYKIQWLPSKWFKVSHVNGRSVRVNEVFGFFQSSFVKALEAWGIGAPDEISRMKERRDIFSRPEIERITAYCLRECDLLVELMDELRDACTEVRMSPRQWIGAGSIADALLNRQEMRPHHAYDLDLASEEVVHSAVLGAYYAGRIELVRQGTYTNVHTADIRSAYPAAICDLPSLDGARLVHRKRFDPSKHGVWRVRWSCPDVHIAPFPVRRKQAIYWPASGEGWYHTVEVAAAIDCGYTPSVLEGWVLRERGERPFDWVPKFFAERQRLKSEGRAAEKVMKLGLNSLYGKTAQGIGFKGPPRWQNYLWAGYITAATRAKMLRAANASRDVLMIATDGIFCRRPGVRGGSRLGAWEMGRLDELFCAQAGVYQGRSPKGEIVKSRGFFADEVDYDELREGYEVEGAAYVHHYRSRRFMGLGVSLMRKDFSVWRTWHEDTRSLLLMPERKVPGSDGLLLPHPGPLLSEPYVPKEALVDGRARDQLEGLDQPMRERI